MSATRDKTQKVAFVYSNLYTLYRKGKDAAIESQPAAAPAQAAPAPTGDVKAPEPDFARPFSVQEAIDRARELQLRGLTTSKVLKPASDETRAAPQVHEYKPTELMAKRLEARNAARPSVVAPSTVPNEKNLARMGLANRLVDRPASLPGRESQHATLESLKQNLSQLNDLHSRLRFMLQELEELVKE